MTDEGKIIDCPASRIDLNCKSCGKPIKVMRKSIKPNGNYCIKCLFESPEYKESKRVLMTKINKTNSDNPKWRASNKKMIEERERDPEYIKKRLDGYKKRSDNTEWKKKLSEMAQKRNQNPEWIEMKTKQNIEKINDPEWKEAHLNGCKEREKDPEYRKDPLYRKRISATMQGIPLEEWKCFVRYELYCEKFNNEFKERVRSFQGHKCAMCGHIWKEGESKLSVHHVNYRKDSCCNEDAPKMFVCLCSNGCHQKTNKCRDEYVDQFTKYVNDKFGGKCYYTKEEYAALKSKN